MKQTITLTIILLAGLCQLASGQAGKIAFISYNSDNPDGFCFVLTENIPANTTIHFTDNGWKSNNTFRSGESTFTWTSPDNELAAGTIVCINETANTGTIDGSLSLAEGTDQILAFTGTKAAPTFLAAVQVNSTGTWDDNAGEPDESTLPAGLENGVTCVALPGYDNGVYVGPLSGTTNEILQRVNNPVNWYGNDQNRMDTNPELFPCNVLTGNGDWDVVSNWKTGTIPSAQTSVIVAAIKDLAINTTNAACKNMYIHPRSTVNVLENRSLHIYNNLVLQSRSATYAAAILNSGTLQIYGTTAYDRYVTSNDWHLISPPVSGQTSVDFVLANDIEYFDDGQDYDLAPYQESNDTWGPYTLANGTNSILLQPGIGYSMRCKSSGLVRFTGTLNQSDIILDLERSNNGWNCIGNPFAVPIWGTGTGKGSFLETYGDQLDPHYTALFLWDHSSNDYLVYTNESNNKIAPCQGFIVRALNGESTVGLTKSLQVFGSATFKSEEIPWPEITIIATANEMKNQTRIVFNDEMGPGLDPGYDAGKLKGNPDFALYSRMEGNNTDFAVQALPLTGHNDYRIPLGIDCNDGGEVTFSAEVAELPVDMQVVLEDTQSESFTRLDVEGATYTTFLESGSSGAGRFFLHTSEKQTTANKQVENKQLSIAFKDRKIFISHAAPGAQVTMHNAVGKICRVNHLKVLGNTTLDVSGLPGGMYILSIKNGATLRTKKIMITP